MAFLIKSAPVRTAGPTTPGTSVLSQAIHVVRAAKVLPQSTTEQLFLVRGGRVLVRAMLGEVTTVLTATDPVSSINSSKLNAALDTIVGTTVAIATTVDTASLEVGGTVFVEGDGTALVKANAGCVFIGAVTGMWLAPRGEIYLTTTGNNTTGAMKWEIWYEPWDAGAYVTAVDVATAAV